MIVVKQLPDLQALSAQASGTAQMAADTHVLLWYGMPRTMQDTLHCRCHYWLVYIPSDRNIRYCL